MISAKIIRKKLKQKLLKHKENNKGEMKKAFGVF